MFITNALITYSSNTDGHPYSTTQGICGQEGIELLLRLHPQMDYQYIHNLATLYERVEETLNEAPGTIQTRSWGEYIYCLSMHTLTNGFQLTPSASFRSRLILTKPAALLIEEAIMECRNGSSSPIVNVILALQDDLIEQGHFYP